MCDINIICLVKQELKIVKKATSYEVVKILI